MGTKTKAIIITVASLLTLLLLVLGLYQCTNKEEGEQTAIMSTEETPADSPTNESTDNAAGGEGALDNTTQDTNNVSLLDKDMIEPAVTTGAPEGAPVEDIVSKLEEYLANRGIDNAVAISQIGVFGRSINEETFWVWDLVIYDSTEFPNETYVSWWPESGDIIVEAAGEDISPLELGEEL